jgi:hypothetical protein
VVQPSFETRAKPLRWYSSVSHSRGAPQAALSPISAHNRVRSHIQERGPRRDFLEKEDRLSAYFLSLDLCEGLELPAINANTFARTTANTAGAILTLAQRATAPPVETLYLAS